MTISWFHYVRLPDVPLWEELGWRATGALRGTGHGDYSDLMTWEGEGDPQFPEKESDF